MKRFVILIFLSFVVSSCILRDFNPQEWALDPVLELSENGIVFNGNRDSCIIRIVTNYQQWSARSNMDWCKITVEGDSLFVSVDPNETVESRQASVTVSISRGSKSLSRELSVFQSGGYWEMVGSHQVFWSHIISEDQKQILSELINNMVFVEGDFFYAGSQNTDEEGKNYVPFLNQNNVHRSAVNNFYICKYELRQKEWVAVMGEHAFAFYGSELPVENITWDEAVLFTQKLSNLTGKVFSLPTEIQWEYAARGGIKDVGFLFSGSDRYEDVSYFLSPYVSTQSPMYSTSVSGSKSCNALGLFDMSGNVAEYCLDWYSDEYAGQSGEGPFIGTEKVVRGGNFMSDTAKFCVYYRDKIIPDRVIDWPSQFVGIRLVMQINE